MKNHIVCIASEYKGNEFLEEAHSAGWQVTLVTRHKLLEMGWPWDSISDVKAVDDNAGVMDYVRAVTNIAGLQRIDRVVGLDEFDVMTAAMTRTSQPARYEPRAGTQVSGQIDDAFDRVQGRHRVP